MSVFEAIVLGTVQGVTEFIPISSSGHLVLVPEALGWDKAPLSFDVLLHTASLVALLVYFSGELLDLARGVAARDRGQLGLLTLLAVGTVPAVLAGLFLHDYFEDQFEDATASAVQLIITAVILVAGELLLRWRESRAAERGMRLRRMDDMGPVDAGAIGVAQAIAIFPGISRSGSTIATGLGFGIARDDAARFAFLLAIPALLGATVLELPELGDGDVGVAAGAAGFVASLVSSYGAIWGLIRFLRTRTLYPFAIYCVVGGLFFLAVT